MTNAIKLYKYSYNEIRIYLAGAIFILGNLLLPQIFHILPQGGKIFLPIYFCTLIGSYKYGWKLGMLAAIFSPVLNSALFGMPAPAALPAILSKSIILALSAGALANKFKNASILSILSVVALYQILGSLAEWIISGSFSVAIQDFTLGIPGILFQIFGAFLLLNYVLRK